jgi:biotin carboxylase
MSTSYGKRIFILGASILQLPAIQKAKEMGLYVAVADINPEAVGIPMADEFFQVSTIDEIGVYEAAKHFEADGIITLATDMPMRSVAYACSKLGLIGISYDTAIKATDKGEMMRAFDEHGVEHPWFYILDSIDALTQIREKITYPCISKPTDNAGSRGVILINNETELSAGVKYSSAHGRKGSVIIEEYMLGSEVSVEIIVYTGVPNVLAVTDKLTTGAPHFVEMGHSQPSIIAEDDIDKIRDLASRAVKAVGIDNGPAHVEIMLTEDGPKIIELGARLGGDCITSHLVPLSTGIDMVKAAIQVALGETPDISPKLSKGAAIRYIDAPYGVIERIEGVYDTKKIDGITEVVLLKNIGDSIDEITSSIDRVGFLIAQSESVKDAVQSCEEAIKGIEIIVE